MAANDYYGGAPPVYPQGPPQQQQQQQYQGYGGYVPNQGAGYYSGPPPPTQYAPGPDSTQNQFSHYLQQPQHYPPQPPTGYLQPYQHGQVAPYGQPNSRSSSPLPPGHAYDTTPGPDGGPQDRGLGSALIGGVAGSTLAHKMGGGALGAIAGAVGGAILANAASNKIKDKKKKKKSKKHGHYKKRGSGSSSSGSDSDSSRHGKRYALGYSTGGGSMFGLPHKKKHHGRGSDSD